MWTCNRRGIKSRYAKVRGRRQMGVKEMFEERIKEHVSVAAWRNLSEKLLEIWLVLEKGEA